VTNESQRTLAHFAHDSKGYPKKTVRNICSRLPLVALSL
jgi:hypothetical protein